VRLADPVRERAAVSLARGESNAAAARAAGVHRATVGDWLKDATFSARVDELVMFGQLAPAIEGEDAPDETSAEKLARLVETAWQVAEAAMLGKEGPNGTIPTATQHSNALKTIELARKLEPKVTDRSDVPPLRDLIEQANARRSET
jgi:hypothetical protein